MHEKGRMLIKKAMKEGKIKGLDKSCDYLPCHEGLEDCTFCYCPFYPCNEEDTGGFEKIRDDGSKIWACSSCIFAHKTENARKILEGLLELNSDFNLIPRKKLLELRRKILNQKCE